MVLAIWKAEDLTLITTYGFRYFRIKRRCRIVSAQCDNSTRPEADARHAFIGVGPEDDEFGETSTLLKIGYTCQWGNVVYEPRQPLILEPTQQLIFRVDGEIGDVMGARVLYEFV